MMSLTEEHFGREITLWFGSCGCKTGPHHQPSTTMLVCGNMQKCKWGHSETVSTETISLNTSKEHMVGSWDLCRPNGAMSDGEAGIDMVDPVGPM